MNKYKLVTARALNSSPACRRYDYGVIIGSSRN